MIARSYPFIRLLTAVVLFGTLLANSSVAHEQTAVAHVKRRNADHDRLLAQVRVDSAVKQNWVNAS